MPRMAHDFDLDVDSIILRLLEGECMLTVATSSLPLSLSASFSFFLA